MNDISFANIFSIYRGTTHDGPGLRTTVFFSGCPLTCRWCHNPEGISEKQNIWWDPVKCISCRSCVNVCQEKAVLFDHDGIHIRKQACSLCMKCTDICPANAITPIYEKYALDDLFQLLKKDKSFYQVSGGGVTASGGEATLQYKFVAALFEKLKKDCITTALDTCGHVNFKNINTILPFTDYILYDLKLFDSTLHRQYTGVSNELILDNLRYLIELNRTQKHHFKIWIRTPLIPGITSTVENITAISLFLKPFLGKEIERWEMCTFNNTCKKKYQKLGLNWEFSNYPMMSDSEVSEIRTLAASLNLPSDQIVISGIIK